MVVSFLPTQSSGQVVPTCLVSLYIHEFEIWWEGWSSLWYILRRAVWLFWWLYYINLFILLCWIYFFLVFVMIVVVVLMLFYYFISFHLFLLSYSFFIFSIWSEMKGNQVRLLFLIFEMFSDSWKDLVECPQASAAWMTSFPL